jgi:hypothetical protein
MKYTEKNKLQPVKNVHTKDERERVLENFETCLSREECAPQFSERIHKQKETF